MLAALATDGDGLHDALLVAFSHLFFNLFGILIFYPIPLMRFPLPLCKILGNATAKYRWVAIAYLILMFLVVRLLSTMVALVVSQFIEESYHIVCMYFLLGAGIFHGHQYPDLGLRGLHHPHRRHFDLRHRGEPHADVRSGQAAKDPTNVGLLALPSTLTGTI
jgi:hypothetical protein